MKFLKFRIKNYKSIKDSGDCYLSQLTIFAGKNESGKTSILEALEDFHEDRLIRNEAIPLGTNLTPEVCCTFLMAKIDANEVLKANGFQGKLKNDVELSLVKKHGSSQYLLTDETRTMLGVSQDYAAVRAKVQLSIMMLRKKLGNQTLIQSKKLSESKEVLLGLIGNTQLLNELGEKKEAVIKHAEEIIGLIDQYFERERNVSVLVDTIVSDHLPFFILYSSFEDEFPSEVLVNDLGLNSWAKDLEEISEFSIKQISSENPQTRVNHETEVNVDFGKKFKKFWTQDDIKLQIKKDGEKLNFWIQEGGINYLPSQRSKGQQWYLSFYVKIVARINEKKPNVILIDEPGLYLHAKAQKDLLNVLEKHSSSFPVLFSTHSPYLIEERNLESVRLVEKNSKKNETSILGKIHAHKAAKKETLTPVLTAIGLGLNDSILTSDKINNVVVEGISDTFYLRAFQVLNNKGGDVNFISGGGATNVGIVGSILEGWGASVKFLFDNDPGAKIGENLLEKQWGVLPKLIYQVTSINNGTIEDVLSKNDFRKYVLNNEEGEYAHENSEEVEGKNKDKVLLARLFLQKVKDEKVDLDPDSKSNIASLLNAIGS